MRARRGDWASRGLEETMPDNDATDRMQRLRTVKSAFILEARSLKDQNLAVFALPLYRRAADLELELADLFRSMGRDRDAWVNLFSAASCLVQARQFQAAAPLLEQVADKFPEAKEMLAECQGKSDEPLVTNTPAVQALVDLLIRKRLITTDEWTEALQAT